MLVLYALEDRELPARAHVHFKLRHAVDDVIVDALGVLAVAFAAGLPMPFEEVASVVRERYELRRRLDSEAGADRRDTYTGEKPGTSGSRRPHDAPFSEPVRVRAEYHRYARR